MKKILIALFLIFLFAFNAYADEDIDVIVVGAGSAAPACTTQEEQLTQEGNAPLGYDTALDRYAAAFSFTPDSTYSAKTVYVYAKKTGSPTANITLSLCTDNGSPNVCTTADAQYASATLTTSYAWIKFNFAAGYAISSGTTYWVKLFWDGAISASNYTFFGFLDSGGTKLYKISEDAVTWYSGDSTANGTLKIRDCVE